MAGCLTQIGEKASLRLVGAYALGSVVAWHIADGHARGPVPSPQSPALPAAEHAKILDVAIAQGNMFLAWRRKDLGLDFQSTIRLVRAGDHVEARYARNDLGLDPVWNSIDTDKEGGHRFLNAEEFSSRGSLLGALLSTLFFSLLARQLLGSCLRCPNFQVPTRSRILASHGPHHY
jgi:hypothetical protein